MAMISALQQRSKTPRRNGNVDPAIPAQITCEARDAPVALHAPSSQDHFHATVGP